VSLVFFPVPSVFFISSSKNNLKANSAGGEFERLNKKLSRTMLELNLSTSAEEMNDQEKFTRAVNEDINDMLSKVKKHAKELLPYDYDKMVAKNMRASIVERLSTLKDGTAQQESDLGSFEIPFYELRDLKEIGKGGQAIVRIESTFFWN
jgi:hypothetical protein